MTEVSHIKTTVFKKIIAQPSSGYSQLYIDSNTFVNMIRMGVADYLVRTGRQIVLTEEVYEEIGLHGNPDVVAARLDWIEQNRAFVLTPSAAEQGRVKITPGLDPTTGMHAGELSIKVSLENLPDGSDVIGISDDGSLALKYIAGIDTPILTGNYMMSSLLTSGAISPWEYFGIMQQNTGFRQTFFADDQASELIPSESYITNSDTFFQFNHQGLHNFIIRANGEVEYFFLGNAGVFEMGKYTLPNPARGLIFLILSLGPAQLKIISVSAHQALNLP